MDLLRQNREDLYEERHGGDVAVVPEGAGTESATVSRSQVKHRGRVEASAFLLLYQRVNASLPGGHLKRQVCDGQRQLGGGRWDRTGTQKDPVSGGWRSVCRPAHLCDDDGRQVFQVLDVGQQRIPQRVVGFGGKLVEGRLDLHLHGLSSKVAGLHVLLELQQLV